jgi:hypothetical protein
VPLRPDLQTAKDRMDKAKAASLADVENSEGTDTARRERLIDELQRAADDYMERIATGETVGQASGGETAFTRARTVSEPMT